MSRHARQLERDEPQLLPRSRLSQGAGQIADVVGPPNGVVQGHIRGEREDVELQRPGPRERLVAVADLLAIPSTLAGWQLGTFTS